VNGPDYYQEPAAGGLAMAKDARPRPLIDRLKDRRRSLQMQCDEVDAAIKAIEEHPDTVRVLDALAKLGPLSHL
jgi:hypothetical protein